MSNKVETVAILGLGLIGGSLAKALRASGFCQRILGYGHREPSLRRGLELGVIDAFTLDLEEAITTADILVICTPTLVADSHPCQRKRPGRTGIGAQHVAGDWR